MKPIYKRSEKHDLEEWLIEMYLSNVSFEEMEKRTGLKYLTLQKYLGDIRRAGKLPRGKRKPIKRNTPLPTSSHYRTNKERQEKKNMMKHVDNDFWSDEGVFCDREKSMECIHGTYESCPYLCDYLSNTGHMRGCPPTDCHRFQKGNHINSQPEFVI